MCVANLGLLALAIFKRKVLWIVCSFTLAEGIRRRPAVAEGSYGFFVVFVVAVGKKGKGRRGFFFLFVFVFVFSHYLSHDNQ